ncbi:hypothetical protein X777_14254, partial [Ooceraea biroi]
VNTWMESFTMILSLLSGQAPLTILLLFRGRLQRLLSTCEELWATLSATEKKCVHDYAKTTQRLTYFYLFGCAFTIFFYAVASLFVAQRDESSNVTTRVLPYARLVEVSRTPCYEIRCSMINVGVTCVAADTIGPVLILTVSGHFKVLNSRMLNLSNRACWNKCPRNRAKPDLQLCVQYHQIVFDEAISKAVYCTSWYHFSYALKRSLNIVALRSQKAAQLTAGYFVPLSLQTFASVRFITSDSSLFTTFLMLFAN